MFEDVEVIGQLAPSAVASKLQEMGDLDTADEIIQSISDRPGTVRLFGWGAPKPWQHTTHQFGYIGFLAPGSTGPQSIQYPGAIAADPTLKNHRVNIHLDRLRIYEYPGRGMHHVMFTFQAQNQLPNSPEPVSFSQTYRAQQGQLAGIAGYPIFIGLNVGTLGAAFQGFTVNVKNDADEAVLNLLDSPPFQSGLNLLTTVQPAIIPFTQITLGVAKMLATRNRNVAVQDFYLGLDFTPAALGVRLAEGNYVAVQVSSETSINWEDWVYRPATGAITSKADETVSMPYNYVVFRVSRYEG
jgi:hypothetical protein